MEDENHNNLYVITVLVWLVGIWFFAGALPCAEFPKSCGRGDLWFFAVCSLGMLGPAWLGAKFLRECLRIFKGTDRS